MRRKAICTPWRSASRRWRPAIATPISDQHRRRRRRTHAHSYVCWSIVVDAVNQNVNVTTRWDVDLRFISTHWLNTVARHNLYYINMSCIMRAVARNFIWGFSMGEGWKTEWPKATNGVGEIFGGIFAFK